MTEIELKLTLDESGYRTFIDHMKTSLHDTLDQWNIYFETAPTKLNLYDANLRLRRIISNLNGTKYFLTSKVGGRIRNGVSVIPEYEVEISEALAKKLIKVPKDFFSLLPKEIQNPLQEAKDLTFSIDGDMRTIRRVILFNELTIEADETFLPNSSTFYELEIETQDPENARSIILEELQTIGVTSSPSRYSKRGRLMSLPPESRFSREKYSFDEAKHCNVFE